MVWGSYGLEALGFGGLGLWEDCVGVTVAVSS